MKNDIIGKPRPCNKVSYRTEKDAQDQISFILRTAKNRTLPLRAYPCPACHTWHLTKKPKKNSQNPDIEYLKQQLIALKEENTRLTQQINNLKNNQKQQIDTEVKKDQAVKKLKKTIQEQQETISRLIYEKMQLKFT